MGSTLLAFILIIDAVTATERVLRATVMAGEAADHGMDRPVRGEVREQRGQVGDVGEDDLGGGEVPQTTEETGAAVILADRLYTTSSKLASVD